MRKHLILLGAVLAMLAAYPAAQQPSTEGQPDDATQPSVTFRVEVNYVEVDASVFDRDGKFVGDLTKEDFQVREDGMVQDITAFSLVNIPIERAERPLFVSRPIEPDVATNVRPFDGRLYVIVLDDIHTAPFRTGQVRRAAREFIEQYMADNDMAAVVYTGGRITAGQDFTSSKPLLLAAIDRFTGRKIRSTTLERLDDYQRQRQVPMTDQITRLNDALEPERGRDALATLDVLNSISEWIGGIRGRRKAILFLSEGIDYDIYDFNKRDASSIQDRMRDIIATAARSNVSIYAADPRGLSLMGEESIETTGGFPEDPLLNLRPTSFLDELRLAQSNLRTLAEDTGGFAAVDTNQFAGAWKRVVADNSQYYVIGYYSKNERRDGKYRKIELRVPGRSNVEIRSRKGYTAPRGKAPSSSPPPPGNDKTSPELRQALDSPVPLPGITLRAFAAPFKGQKPNASVAVGVETDGTDLQFASKDGKFVDDLEVSVVAIDATGKIRGGDRSILNMGLKPETRTRVLETGIRMNTRLNLEPGRYQIRVAARETGAGRVGTVNYDLEVPDFSKDKLVMSGVVVAAASQQQTMTAKPDEELKGVLPAPATATRTFPSGDTLAVFAEIYDNAPSPTHVVELTASVLADDGRVLFSTSDERSSSELQGKAGGYGYSVQIPLKDYQPGLYVLQIAARSRRGNDPAITRQIPFRVR